MFQINEAVAVYSLAPYLALCNIDRCLLIQSSGLEVSPLSSPFDGNRMFPKLPSALLSVLVSENIVKMGIDVTPLMAGLLESKYSRSFG